MKENILYTLLGTVLLTSYFIYLKPKPSSKNEETQTNYYKRHDQSSQTDENFDYTEGVFSSQLTTSSDNSNIDIDWKYVIQGLE